MKKFSFTIVVCCLLFIAKSQSKFTLALGGGPAYTFHQPYDYTDGVGFFEYGNRKGPIGYTYAIDVKLQKKVLSWGVQYNFREFREKIDAEGFLGAYTNGVFYPQASDFQVQGNLYHKQKMLNLYAEIVLRRKDDFLVSVGLGPSFYWERNQYMYLTSGEAPYAPFEQSGFTYRMYSASEGGIYTFMNFEKKFKKCYSIGMKFDVSYLISLTKLESVAFFPYLKVEL